MGGRIEATSAVGRGSTFTLVMPLAVAEAPAARPVAAAPAAVHGSLAGTTVVVAEDDATNQAVVVAMLELLQVRPIVAATGHEALAALATHRVDAVLMDVHLPGLDGLSATRAWRQRGGSAAAALPFVAMTGSTGPEDIAACREAGMDVVLAKPFALAQLQRVLLEATRPAAAQSRLAPRLRRRAARRSAPQKREPGGASTPHWTAEPARAALARGAPAGGDDSAAAVCRSRAICAAESAGAPTADCIARSPAPRAAIRRSSSPLNGATRMLWPRAKAASSAARARASCSVENIAVTTRSASLPNTTDSIRARQTRRVMASVRTTLLSVLTRLVKLLPVPMRDCLPVAHHLDPDEHRFEVEPAPQARRGLEAERRDEGEDRRGARERVAVLLPGRADVEVAHEGERQADARRSPARSRRGRAGAGPGGAGPPAPSRASAPACRWSAAAGSPRTARRRSCPTASPRS
jgi:CheY-like chemotaxis protein